MGKTIRQTEVIPDAQQVPRDPWIPRPAGEMKPKPRRYKGSKAAKKASRRNL